MHTIDKYTASFRVTKIISRRHPRAGEQYTASAPNSMQRENRRQHTGPQMDKRPGMTRAGQRASE